MADDEHVSMLRPGGQRWNAWHREHASIISDLRRAELNRADLREGPRPRDGPLLAQAPTPPSGPSPASGGASCCGGTSTLADFARWAVREIGGHGGAARL